MWILPGCRLPSVAGGAWGDAHETAVAQQVQDIAVSIRVNQGQPEADPTSVFLSYSSKDREICQRLATDLNSCGLKVWCDQRSLRAGEALTEETLRGINSSYWFIPILSPNALASQWWSLELAAAMEKETASEASAHILPVLYRDCEVPERLHDLAHADFRYSYSEGLTSLLNALNAPVQGQIEASLLSENEQKNKVRVASHRGRRPAALHGQADGQAREPGGTRALLCADGALAPETPRCAATRREMSAQSFARRSAASHCLRWRIPIPVSDPRDRRIAFHRDPGVREAARQGYRRLTGRKP